MRSNVANLWRKIYPEKVDHFDKLPEEIILSIFNRIGNAMALRRCCAVSRRFHSIVPEVDHVVVLVNCVTLEKEKRELASSSSAAAAPHHRIASFFCIFFSVLFKPLLSLSQLIIPSARLLPLLKEEEEEDKTVSLRSMTQILKNFNEIKRLAVELRAGEVRIEDGILLKLKAEYSSTLESCVILGATSVNCSCDDDDDDDGADMDSIHESFYSEDEGLAQRVVWIVNSLVAASTRHHLLQPVIAAHKSLERLVLTDADGQGLLSMDKEQLKEQRARPLNMSLSSKRTVVPSLDVQLWYAPRLEMPDGVVLRGATLIAIRPSELPREGAMPVGSESSWAEPEGNWVVSAFEGPYGDVARMLVKERIYSIDINAF
ncbi:hypothetical protein SASPL_130175 [Salvia splendens]|uniref:F-box domain-containing protein n=1 Tax=Salvia splendens TaxID=180675 RepID=A0A8X8X8G0_SALSN|nr:F-box protein At4g18380-like [Salvia splendens]KAG6407191.1 hypothetical protein SASPL_130175 [Salvia splendens]